MSEGIIPKRYEVCKELLSELLDCGTEDVEVLLDINRDILLEATERLRDSGVEINFQTLYVEAVHIACEREGLDPYRDVSIDANYSVARVYAGNKRNAEKLEKYGFVVLPY